MPAVNWPAPDALPALREAEDADTEGLVALWRLCGLTRPWNDPGQDIALARRSPEATILVAGPKGAPFASAMVGHDGHRGWVYYLAVAPAAQGRGLGRHLMRACEAWVAARGIPKLQLMVRADNLATKAFYARLGYVAGDVVVMSRWVDGR